MEIFWETAMLKRGLKASKRGAFLALSAAHLVMGFVTSATAAIYSETVSGDITDSVMSPLQLSADTVVGSIDIFNGDSSDVFTFVGLPAGDMAISIATNADGLRVHLGFGNSFSSLADLGITTTLTASGPNGFTIPGFAGGDLTLAFVDVFGLGLVTYTATHNAALPPPSEVPIPGALVLFATGGAVLAMVRRRWTRKTG